MASAIDDLRYISKYGYQDPWAEATKSISDSLLAYGQSKLKRDLLIAEYEDKKQLREDNDADKKLKNSMGILDLAIDSGDYKVALNYLNEIDMPEGDKEVTKGILNRKVNEKESMNAYWSTVNEEGSSYDEVSSAISNIIVSSERSGNNNIAKSARSRQQFIDNKRIKSFANQSLSALIESNANIIKDEQMIQIDKMIELNNYKGAWDYTNSIINKYTESFEFGYSSFNAEMENLQSLVDTREENGNPMTQSNYDSLRASIEGNYRGLFIGTGYDKDSKTGQILPLDRAFIKAITHQKTKAVPPGGLVPDPPVDDDSALLPVYNSMLDIQPDNFIPSSTSVVSLIDSKTHKSFISTGLNAKNLIKLGIAEMDSSPESIKKSYIKLASTSSPDISQRANQFESRISRHLSYEKQDGSGTSISLNKGDFVMNIKSGKVYKVDIKELDKPKTQILSYSPAGFGIPRVTHNVIRYVYIVDGVRYTESPGKKDKELPLSEFKRKFAVQIFTGQRLLNKFGEPLQSSSPGYSARRLTPNSVVKK